MPASPTPHTTLRTALALACVTAGVAACDDVEPAAARPPLPFEVAGCAHVDAEGVCELGEARALVVWVGDLNEEAPQLRVGESELNAESRRLQGGIQLRAEVPAGARALIIEAGDQSATLRLRPTTYPARLDTLLALRGEGKLEELEEALTAARANAEAPLLEARLDGVEARLRFSQGRAEESVALYRRSIPALQAAGRVSEAATDACAAFYVLGEQLQRFSDAREMLDAHEASFESYSEGHAWLAYYRSISAVRTGELGVALERLEELLQRTERLDRVALRSLALQVRSWVDGVLGHHDAALQAGERALAAFDDPSDCARAAALNNVGWHQLLAVEAGRGALEPARARFRQALALLANGCHDRPLESNLHMNLAQAALLEGEFEEAQRQLSEAQAASDGRDTVIETYLLDLRGRTLLEQGDAAGALRTFDELSARIALSGATLPQGELGRGLALRDLGRLPEAAEALQRAEAEIDRQMVQVPLGLGRDTFSVGRAEAATALVRTLLDLGRFDRALGAARHARARMLASLPRLDALDGALPPAARASREKGIESYWRRRREMEERASAAWRLPADELATLRERESEDHRALQRALTEALPGVQPATVERELQRGELLLAFFHDEAEMLVFAKTGDAHRALWRPSNAPETWLEGFEDMILGAQRVTVLAPERGPASNAHRLPVDGEPLIAQLPVAYALDLPSRDASPARGERLFVIDPTGDLPGAWSEGEWLREHAQGGTWLEGRDVTHERVLEKLQHASHFHFAGHADYVPDPWWTSGLRLASGGSLTIADILALERVPETVVLAGCETAASRGEGVVASVGIAHSLLLRGAQSVVATSVRVDDEAALVFTRAFYGSAERDITARVRTATLAVREAGLPWTPFRLMVP